MGRGTGRPTLSEAEAKATSRERRAYIRRVVGPLICGAAILTLACAGPAAVQDETGAAGAGSPHALILVSLDGFRWDYRQITQTPGLDALAADGVQAESLLSVFPSKTFPAHYSIVTGLLPANHGIVSNNMRDPRWEGVFGLGRPELTEGRWWGGEPIWTTVARQGLVAAAFFWPGSDVLIDGERPRYFFPYDGNVPYEDRVDQVIEWLELPAGERPSFITLYFADPNDTSHDFGPEAPEALAAVRRVDAMVDRLVKGLESRGMRASTDIVVTSDHGMALMDLSRIVFLDDHVELGPDELFESGAFVQIYPREGRQAEILERLRGADPHLAVYANDEIPERYRLAGSPRLAPIIAVPDIGWMATVRNNGSYSGEGFLLGNHGGDPLHPDMQGIFIASGPSFARGATVPSIESVDVYNLLAAALGIEPAPNDGQWERVAGILAPEPAK